MTTAVGRFGRVGVGCLAMVLLHLEPDATRSRRGAPCARPSGTRATPRLARRMDSEIVTNVYPGVMWRTPAEQPYGPHYQTHRHVSSTFEVTDRVASGAVSPPYRVFKNGLRDQFLNRPPIPVFVRMLRQMIRQAFG